uniref:Uncharacterized protein n=1 Tax=Sphaerodactylus townsendi TaxID=933632 RepID=A0ACB8FF46_9SAUR
MDSGLIQLACSYVLSYVLMFLVTVMPVQIGFPFQPLKPKEQGTLSPSSQSKSGEADFQLIGHRLKNKSFIHQHRTCQHQESCNSTGPKQEIKGLQHRTSKQMPYTFQKRFRVATNYSEALKHSGCS